MRAALLSIVSVAALSIACGGADPPAANPPPAVPTTPSTEPAAHAEHDDHGAMKPALHDFHEALAPIWHATPGAERIGKACTGQGDLRAKAAAVGDAELTADADAVKAACDKPDHADVEAKLSTVHDRFHKLAEAH